MKFRDYYEVLGVPRGAGKDEIRKAFRKLARTHHPDVAGEADKAKAEERFKEINEAYEVLGDEEKRKKYDAFGQNWKHGDGFTPPPGSGGGGFPQGWQTGASGDMEDAYHFEGTGFSDFFENVFGGRAGRGGFARGGAASSGGSRPRRGRDIESEILVTLDEVMSGAERTLAIQPQGGGERRTVTIRIPKGVTEGQMIRAAGLGQPGTAGGEAGDLFLHVRLERHPDYRVVEHDLYLDLRLAPWEAVLGATIAVRTPHGETRIRVPAGTEAGTEFRLSGKGLPKGKSGDSGHLFAVARIAMPPDVTDEEKRHWQALADISKFNPRQS
ncbi:DnaJ domain-containing protein [Luteolibacter flavescens]|uniref:DnaJ domain-containing protein n=1 Tax=Luteolibacter flavescens TaxID=1859460 RepID=A0ABT3FMC1_9BACT|nr:DnaJ C-terminal domain-containing protein [Luteolibacter flavescens]MCW1884724.1 DnaJ domain-containing protein [Luteolibacter flavescens]